MGKTLGYGEITVANMTEPFTVMLTNEAQQFATDSNRKVTSAQSYYTDIIVIRGSQERTDYTIGNITSGSGITVSKSSKRITFSVSAGTTIGADTGVIEIPITLDGQTVKKQFSWSCGKQGPQGVKGEDGSNFAWNLLKGTGTAKEFTPKGNLTNQTTLFNKLDLSGQTLKEGDKFVISCDLEWTQFTQGTSGTFDYWFQGSVDYSWSYDNIFTQGLQKVQPTKAEILASDGKKHLSAVCTMKQSLLDKKIFEIGIRFDNTDGTGKIKISNLKIAKEDKESPWCLHPDELKGATGDKGKSVQSVIEYYLATSASTGVTTSTSGWSTDPTTQKLTAEKKYLWNCKQTVYDDGTRGSITSPVICGTYGDKGQNAKNLSITPSSQYFKSTDGGKTFAPNTITIKPTIQGEINFGKWQYSIDGGVSFADIVSGQKGLTINNNVLTVSKDSSLYSDAVTMVTFRAVASDSSFYDTCSIAKIYDVSDIGDGRNLLWNSNFAKTDEAITGTTNSWGLHTRGTNLVASIDTSTKHNGFNTLKTVSAANGDKNSSNDLEWFAWGISERTSDNLHSKNQNYTLSFYAKASVTTDFIVRWGYDAYGADTTRTLTTNWQKYEIKLHQATSAYSITIIFKLLTAGTVWFSEFKLEKGSSATGYSTAPEDLQTAILSTKSEISDVSLKVDKNKQAIEQRVEKTTYQQDLNLVKGDISKANEGLNKWRYEIYPKSLFASEYQGKSTMDVFAKNTNLTPSQSVLINDTDFGKSWAYGDNYIGYALTFVKFSAAKSIAITFKHDDGAHLYLNGKLIGGDDTCNTGSGESLTLSFIQGWNCLEVVLNEKSGGEYIGLGTTISAISECQLMNCYYGTPVARQSHITNQLVENTTNIDGVSGSVQKVMSTVGGSSKIDEFVNNYSTWKKKVDGIETKVGKTYVTKNDFDGLEIGGVNLFVKSTASRGWWISDTGVLNANGGWGYSDYINVSGMKNYIASGFTNLGISPATCFYDSNKTFISGVQSTNQNSQDSKRKTLPIPSNAKYMRFSFMLVDIDTLKIEQGTKATAYSPAPEDDEINGQNLVSNLPSNWEQGTVTEGSTTGTTYANTKSSSAGSVRPKELIPVSGNITISTAYSNQSKKPIRHWIAAYDVNKNYLGNNYVSNAWNSFPRTLNMKDAKYIAIMVGYTDSSAITPSDISQICLKIERGTSATPFTLAPEDVNGKIVNVETIANQTAKKFEWIVKGGDSSSNFTLTDRVADLVAERINFKGLVTFSGTTNLIENSNMMNGLANITSECKAIKVIDDSTYRKALVITPIAGGRIFWGVANVWKANITYTVSFVAKSSVAGQKIKPSRSVADWGDEITLTTSYVKYTTRIKSTATADGGTLSFSFSNAIGDVTLTNVKLETGMNPTDWSPAPGDYITQASLVRNWTTNTTWINGGKIYTGSITADKIATDAIKSRNYISSGGTQGSFLNLSDGSFQSPNLSWDANGNLIAKNANLSGQITATKGSIAGWTIISDKMYTTGSGKYTGIGKYGSAYAFWAGATSNDNGNSAVFKVGHTGKLTATDADITGIITATSGKIGRYDITETYLMTNSGSNASGIGGDQAFWAGAEDSNSAPFRVGYDGSVYCGSFSSENSALKLTLNNGYLTITDKADGTTAFRVDEDGYTRCTICYAGNYFGKSMELTGNIVANDLTANGYLYCSEVHSSGAVIIGADSESFYWAHGFQIARGTSWGGVCLGDDSQQLRLYGSSIWASHSISTSDENLKENFTTLDQYEDFYMNLNPIGFNYIGDYDGKKTHFGFGAHKTEDILESEGYDSDKFAVVTHRPLVQEDIEKRFGKDVEVDIETEYGVSYTEFIALNTHMIQKTRRELTKVKQEKADLEARLQAIEAKLGL